VRTRWLLAVLLLSCACERPEPARPCQSLAAGVPGFPRSLGFLVDQNAPTPLRLSVDRLTCPREVLQAARAESTLQTADGRRLEVDTTVRVSDDARELELTVVVPPLAPGEASLRVFVEPSLAVFDVWLLSSVDRRFEAGRTFQKRNCGSVAMTTSGGVFCNEPGRVRALHEDDQPLRPGLRQLLAAGEVVWTVELSSSNLQVSRWRDRGDGGLDLLGSTTNLVSRLLSVTSTQAISQSVMFRQAPDGGLTAQPTRLGAAFLLEEGGAFATRDNLEVCEVLDGGCVPSPLATTTMFAFDERRVWLPDLQADVNGGGTGLRSWARPFALTTTEGETLHVPQGYTKLPFERGPMVVQGTRPLVLAREDLRELVVVRHTPRGLRAERFSNGFRIELSNGWLVLEYEQVFRALQLGP
jgi:hypothetical protein